MGIAKMLLVEGKDEELVLPRLCESRGIKFRESYVVLQSKGGYTELLKGIPIEVKSADVNGLEILGIVIDADEDASTRWQAIRDRLAKLGYANLPPIPHKAGTIIPGDELGVLPTIGIWLMPDNEAKGMLETLIGLLVPNREANSLWQYAEQATTFVYDNHKPFPVTHKPKAVLHTWLAWQKKPGTPIGQAITATYLDANNPAADAFITWIKQLFQL